MDFYVGMTFTDYPAGVADWCNEHKKVIADNGIVDGVRQFCIAEPEVPPVTIDDYDQAMEAHITAARVARGYTTREPDCYLNSRNERWAQDAEDFILFRDAVMEYGLSVINEYQRTGIAPSLEEFKNNLPNIVWSYSEETENKEQ